MMRQAQRHIDDLIANLDNGFEPLFETEVKNAVDASDATRLYLSNVNGIDDDDGDYSEVLLGVAAVLLLIYAAIRVYRVCCAI